MSGPGSRSLEGEDRSARHRGGPVGAGLHRVLVLARIAAMRQLHDRKALALAFAMPLLFLTLFAAAMSGAFSAATARPAVAVLDLDRTPASSRLVDLLRADATLDWQIVPAAKEPQAGGLLPAAGSAALERRVRSGELAAAAVLPRGYETALTAGPRSASVAIGLITDSTNNPLPALLLHGAVQRALAIQSGLPMQPVPSPDVAAWRTGPVTVAVSEVFHGPRQAVGVAMCASTIGVFILLMGVPGVGGSVLEEIETGTLSRVLSGPTTMNQVLAGKLLFAALFGAAQMLALFVWAALWFDVTLWPHLGGVALLCVTTAFATSAFGLMLGMAVWTRAQLLMVSTLVTTLLAAVGGLIVPRASMSPLFQQIGLAAFNSWSIDGFSKIFTRGATLAALWPQLLVLSGCTALFMLLACRLSRRWQGWL